jgi:serine/threonine protein kinase
VLYEMLAQEPPFSSNDAMEVLAAIVEKEPPPLPPSVPLGLHHIVLGAMRKSMYERTQTVAALLEELTELRLDLTIRERIGRAARV